MSMHDVPISGIRAVHLASGYLREDVLEAAQARCGRMDPSFLRYRAGSAGVHSSASADTAISL